MARTVIDLDETMVAEAMRIFGTKTKAQAVRLAMEDAVKRRLRQEGFDAMDSRRVRLQRDRREHRLRSEARVNNGYAKARASRRSAGHEPHAEARV